MIPFELTRLINPSWTSRNKLISSLIPANQSVLDLGCGAKDLLNYYTPTKYLGVDCVDTADIKCDLDKELDLPTGWDYVVNSGILEYLDDIPSYLKKVSKFGSTYIFTWHPTKAKWSPNKPAITHDEFKELVSTMYNIIETTTWTKQIIVKCVPK